MVLVRGGIPQHDDGAGGAVGRDAQDFFSLGLLVVVAEPGGAATKAKQMGANQEALGDAALVKRLRRSGWRRSGRWQWPVGHRRPS